MANTITISALRKQLWRKQLFADVQDELFMTRFIGTGSNSMIQEVEDLKKDKGDRITIGLGVKLSGDGVTGDSELEGSEERMTDYSEVIIVDQLRHAVRLTGNMDEKKSAYNMRMSAKEGLKIWWAERIDKEILYKICSDTSQTFANTPDAPASTRTIWANDAGATASLTADEVIEAERQIAL